MGADADRPGNALEIDPTDFTRQYAAIGNQRGNLSYELPGSIVNGVYRSLNGGDNWTRIDGPWGASVGRIELSISPSSPNVLYASVQSAGSNMLFGLFRTDNAWAPTPTWVTVPTGLAGDGGYCGPGKCGYSHVIAVDPANPNTVFAGGAERGFWRCTNCGATPTWTNTTAGAPVHPDHHALAWAGHRLIVLPNRRPARMTLRLALLSRIAIWPVCRMGNLTMYSLLAVIVSNRFLIFSDHSYHNIVIRREVGPL